MKYLDIGDQRVYTHDDDAQVSSKLLLGTVLVREALEEMRRRDMLTDVRIHAGPVGRELLDRYLRDIGEDSANTNGVFGTAIYKYARIGEIVYENMQKIRDKGSDV